MTPKEGTPKVLDRLAADMLVERDVGVEVDGVRLATDVYRLVEGPPRPCLVQRVPYDRRHPAIVNGALDVARAVERGYAVVVQDCRGRFGSEGSFEPFAHEGADGAATVEWAAAQPWCDGNVGMFGRSYSGLSQWQVAARDDVPHLRAIAPMLSGADLLQGWLLRNGSLEWGFVLLWALRHLAPDMLARIPAGTLSMDDLLGHLERLDERYWDLRPEEAAELSGALPFLRTWLDAEDDEGARRTLEAMNPELADVRVPAMVVAGWYDIFLDGALDAFEALTAHGDEGHRLLVGAWPHGGTNPGVFPEQSFGLMASSDAVRLADRQLDFFDSWLGTGREADRPAAAHVFVMGADRWLDCAWPPTGVRRQVLHLRADDTQQPWSGDLASEVAPDAVTELAFDVNDPVPTVGGQTFLPGLEVAANAGPRDQSRLLGRSDLVAYLSPPLHAPVRVIGRALAHLRVRGAPAGLRFVGRLADVDRRGRTMLITEGTGRLAGTDDGESRMRLSLGATGHEFASGHRIAFLLANTSFPRYRRAVVDGAGGPTRGTVHLLLGGAHGCRLELPVVGS